MLGAILTDCARVLPGDDLGFEIEHARNVAPGAYEPGLTQPQIEVILKDRMGSNYQPGLAVSLYRLCQYYRFDPTFVLSVIHVESHFRPEVVSPMGAVGLMQLMPATARVIVRNQLVAKEYRGLKTIKNLNRASEEVVVKNLMDPLTNVALGMAYLSYLRDKYIGFHPFYLIAAYNVGPAKMDELISRKTFKPVSTKKYFEAIKRSMSTFRTPHGPV